MLTKNIFLSVLVSLFCLSLMGAANACTDGCTLDHSRMSLGQKASAMNTAMENIDFDYSPRTDSNVLVFASTMNSGGDDIDFDYSPRTNNNGLASASTMNSADENIDFDYSPRIDSRAHGSFSAVNFEGDTIEFDYSPRPLMCEGSSC